MKPMRRSGSVHASRRISGRAQRSPMIDPYQREPDGTFARQHKDKMLDLARHEEAAKRKEHPLNRIGDVAESAQGIVIHTADIHLPRRIGEAIRRAFHGSIDMDFDENSYFVRVDWHPPA